MIATLRAHRADLLALLLITLAAAAFFAPVWAGGGWLPAGGGDLASFLWPTATFSARTIPGDLPLWNPHQYGGAPFWADNQSGVLYPPNLLLALLTDAPSYAALELLVMLHVWLAGLGMYACLRLLRPAEPLSPAPAALGGIAFMLSDVFVTHQGNLNLIAVAAWLPLVFLGTWRALEKGKSDRARMTRIGTDTRGSEPGFLSVFIRLTRVIRALCSSWAILAGAAFGIGTLAGHAQMTYFSALLVGAAGLWHFCAALWDWRRGRADGGAALRVIGTLAAIGIIAFGLSAAGLIPTLELTGYTARAGLSYADAAAYSLPPRALIGLVAPWVDGRGPAAFTGDWARVEVGYIGALALILALAGAIRGVRRRDGLALFLTLGGIVAFLLALGEYFPLHRLAYDLVPGMQSLRVPARFVLLADFAAAALAGMALQAWLNRTRAGAARHAPSLQSSARVGSGDPGGSGVGGLWRGGGGPGGRSDDRHRPRRRAGLAARPAGRALPHRGWPGGGRLAAGPALAGGRAAVRHLRDQQPPRAGRLRRVVLGRRPARIGPLQLPGRQIRDRPGRRPAGRRQLRASPRGGLRA